MGLPGSGKTTLAQALAPKLNAHYFNADQVREQFNDWDFSRQGRIRQSHRMRELADASSAEFVISDFVAPLAEMRCNYQADWIIWVDTIRKGRYADTNTIFEAPDYCDFHITEQNAEKWADFIAGHILDSGKRRIEE
jgi:adenylylsulfate kinase